MWDLFFCDSYELKVVRKWEIWKKGKFRLFFPFRPFFCLPSCYPVSRLSGCVWPQVQGIWGNQQSWFTMIFVWTVFLGERSNKKTRKQNILLTVFSCPPFTSRNVHQPVFFFSSFSTLEVLRVSTALPSLSSFPSEIFGQLWLNVCITEVVTLTSCLIPGPSQLNWWPE